MTLLPSRDHTEPSSSPIYPPPITASRSGTRSSASAPVEDTIRRSSNAKPGSGMLSEPVATMIAPASTPALPSSERDPARARRCGPRPFSQSTLFLRNRNSTPRVSVVTTLSLRSIIAARSSPTSPILTPCSARPWRASANFSEDCSSAFDGMQPILRQVPPSVSRLSTQAVRMPSCAARIAAT